MEEMPEINKRIRELVDFKSNRNISKFSEKIGQSHQVVSRIFRTDSRTKKYPSISYGLLKSIYKAFPDVNPKWLEDGIGDMINQAVSANPDVSLGEAWERVKTIMEAKGMNPTSLSRYAGFSSNGTIGKLLSEKRKANEATLEKIADVFPEYNRNWVIYGYGDMFQEDMHEVSAGSERIELILLGLKTSRNKLGLRLGDKNGMRLQHVINGRNRISYDLARDINKLYPGISYEWILTGNGPLPNFSDLIESEGEMIKAKPRPNEAIALPTYDRELEIIKREDGTEFRKLGDESYLMITPLVTQFAYGGYTEGWADPEFIEELPRHAIVVDKLHFGIYRSFQVKGSSMDNGLKGSIAEGYIVTGRRVEQKYWKSKLHLHKYEDFVIVGHDGISVKRIVEHKVEEGIIVCSSLNEDKQKYADFEVFLGEVKELYNIISVTEKK